VSLLFHKVANPDPLFSLNADLDPAFHFTTDVDPYPNQSDANLRPVSYRPSVTPF
jgi:hypothetical protein